MSVLRSVTALGFAAVIGACSQPAPEPSAPVLQGQPIYDKLGGIVGCEDGEYVPGAAPAEQCLPPGDECEPNSTATAGGLPCPDPGRPDDDPDRTPDPGPNDPTNSAARG